MTPPNIELCPARKALLENDGHLLVLGGPGSGKTTISLHKAARDLGMQKLKSGQCILFLSFARATVSRIEENAKKNLAPALRKQLLISTYHGFTWNILRSHGYLLQPSRITRLIPPADAASHMAKIEKGHRDAEKERLFAEEGTLHFDYFARAAADLLRRAPKLCHICSNAYPIIILDEFQDTNQHEWDMIVELGKKSVLIALADPDQRIYEFRGADPRRVGLFASAFTPRVFDFAGENHRSNGTDIAMYGNDLLAGSNRDKQYSHVKVRRYGYYGKIQHYYAKSYLADAIKRMVRSGAKPWSIAVLVRSNSLMMSLSDYFSEANENMRAIPHNVAYDSEGPTLAAAMIGTLFDCHGSKEVLAEKMLKDVLRHMWGRNGEDGPNQENRKLCDALTKYLETGKLTGSTRKAIVDDCERIAGLRKCIRMSGDVGNDWMTIHSLISVCESKPFTAIADDAKYLRLLRKGSVLRTKLSEMWKRTAGYGAASAAIQTAIMQEQFAAVSHEYNGVHVMTFHKAKGKEFDEVVIYEGRRQGRILWDKATEKDEAQARLALRVAVTRARRFVTIATPDDNPCPFLVRTES